MRTSFLFALAAGTLASGLAGTPALAASCLEQIVALQARVDAVTPKQPAPPTAPQTVGAQLDHQPTASSMAAATGNLPPPVGPAAALNAAQNFQAAGDEAACLKAVNEARAMLEGK
ncbi:hypothetical protein [Aquabacter spiritensis]|uniref:Uncharacterized protein n=1 Tax=Aquabacter spiritensis TaxID=933073 RepID=A0A4R3LX35_9HYPH|nr:hypothetical protein [Aquabacter spiritensis]TCT05204.1 hypothetical protein EDC64_105235 [Aquabacter spiritensis]